jgi:hypothetical protein
VREILGHPLPARVQEGLSALQLAPPLACTAERVLVVASESRPSYQELVDRLMVSGIEAMFEHVPDATTPDAPFLLVTRAQERIVKLLTRRNS